MSDTTKTDKTEDTRFELTIYPLATETPVDGQPILLWAGDAPWDKEEYYYERGCFFNDATLGPIQLPASVTHWSYLPEAVPDVPQGERPPGIFYDGRGRKWTWFFDYSKDIKPIVSVSLHKPVSDETTFSFHSIVGAYQFIQSLKEAK
jgi:hypothetical protein